MNEAGIKVYAGADGMAEIDIVNSELKYVHEKLKD